jgi:3-hydroxymyristoyl/3-hydroxydecanoyl-(acyl carrier protein) dehydratase
MQPMSGHFSAFSFVDRITELEVGKRAKGRFLVPAHIVRFPSSLAAEAAGQLAAWNALACLEFRVRPVAGLADEIRFGPEVRPGQTLDLEIVIDTCDPDAVSYSGWAEVDGVRVMELDHSVGPMLPMEDFDSPQALRERFELLCGAGAPSGRFQGLPEHDIEIVEQVPDERVRAILRVPSEAAFFSDHFPRRPVFPATLLLDAQIQLALRLAAEATRWPRGVRLTAPRVPGMKLRSFIPPGEVVELSVEFPPPTGENSVIAKTGARANGRQIASGRLEIVASNSR